MGNCKSVTAGGSVCKLKAGPSGFCHLHDSERIAARKEKEAEEKLAHKKHLEKGQRLLELIEVVKSIARSRGWDAWSQHVDQENWRFATVVVERYIPGSLLGAKVTGAFELALVEGRFRMSNQRTSGSSFGFNELSKSVNEAVQALPWLKFNIESKSEPNANVQPDKTVETRRATKPGSPSKVFVIHGHDNGTKEEVARFLTRIGLEPIILHEQPDRGRTIIEKFEEYSDVSYAVALLTPDDTGAAKRESENLRDRARQNVIFEFGYFVAKLGRTSACAIVKDDVEIPSDYSGVLYIPMDAGGAWRFLVIRELRAAGFEVDANLAL